MKRFAITSMTRELFTKITRRDNMNTIKNKTTSLFNTYKFFFAFGIFYFLVFIAIAFFVSEFFFKSKQDYFEPLVPVISVLFTGLIGLIQKQFEDRKIQKSQQELERFKKETEKDMQLFEKRLAFSEIFLEKLESLLKDNKIDFNEINELIFLLTKLRVHFDEDQTDKIVYSCARIVDTIRESKKPNIGLDYQKIGEELFRISYYIRSGLRKVSGENEFIDEVYKLGQPNKKDDLASLIEAMQAEPDESKPWHVNIGETFGVIQGDQYRCWDDMKTNGFWSAGGAKRYADGVKKLKKNDIIYAYLSGRGYVARGKVIEEAVLVKDFFKGKDSEIKDLKSNQFKENLQNENFEGFHNADIGEYAVSVEWEYPKEKDKAITNKDFKISPMTICKMNEDNRDILEKEFQ